MAQRGLRGGSYGSARNRADREPWNVIPPSGLPLTTFVSMTVHRLFGGSISGGFAPGIVLDNLEARAANGNLAQAGDLLISGTYFWSVGQNFSAIELRGRWTNVIADAVRHECHFIAPETATETAFMAETTVGAQGTVGKAGPGVATLQNGRQEHMHRQRAGGRYKAAAAVCIV